MEDHSVTPFQRISPDGTNYVLGVKNNGSVVAVPGGHFTRPKWHGEKYLDYAHINSIFLYERD